MKKALALIPVLLFLFGCKNGNERASAVSDTTSPGKLAEKYQLDQLTLPQGFSISIYAEVPKARSLCWGAKGTLFIGNKDGNSVYAAVDKNNDGKAETVYTIASGLNTPNGVAFKDGNLYVAEINRILRFDNIEDQLSKPPAYNVIYNKFPDKTHHGWKFIAFGPDGKLYVPVGAPCNVCNESDSIFATITRMNADGSGLEIFAKGIRNSVGFDWNPDTQKMWFTDNGRDLLGDDVPFCELNYAPEKGMHFGFPFFHQGTILDPEFGKGKSCADYTPPAKALGPHIAPLGMRFYTGNSFSSEYKNKIFIAEHGSWNRSTPIGYQVSMVTLNGDKVTDYKPFITGWLQKDGKVTGRPVDVIVAKDGSLLISDDYAGVIYRVSYKGAKLG
ncbi:MAG: sorbosone dehydrogenase family protein [Chitinophagaceae bacterium]|nr:sorbosone dehydrogenase family protein [Chitinophagaceae bacterium]